MNSTSLVANSITDLATNSITNLVTTSQRNEPRDDPFKEPHDTGSKTTRRDPRENLKLNQVSYHRVHVKSSLVQTSGFQQPQRSDLKFWHSNLVEPFQHKHRKKLENLHRWTGLRWWKIIKKMRFWWSGASGSHEVLARSLLHWRYHCTVMLMLKEIVEMTKSARSFGPNWKGGLISNGFFLEHQYHPPSSQD